MLNSSNDYAKDEMRSVKNERYEIHAEDIFLDEIIPSLLSVKDMEEENRPREKMIHLGPDELTRAELLALVLNVGTKREDVLAMASRLLKEYGQSAISNETNARRLSEIAQLPIGKACQIIAAFELGRRYYQKYEGAPIYISTPAQAFNYLKPLSVLQKEQVRALYLNSRYRVLNEEVISIGTVSTSLIHPREILKPAIRLSASAIIIAHNHPSGSLEPTTSDLDTTDRLAIACRIIGIELIDHIIVVGDSYKSILSLNHRSS